MSATRPLDGVQVLDLTWNLPGPYASWLLTSLGASVTKVEPPKGDPARHQPQLFKAINKGKTATFLDLRTHEGQQAFLSLAEGADVVIEGFRPGVAERLGCDAPTVRARNPRVIYCSISAFGQDGPRRNEPGHDLNAQALTGAAWLARDAQGRPQGLPLPIADLSASMAAVSSICAALYRREQTGEGDYLDVAMVDTVLSWTHLWSSGVDLAGAAQEHIPPSLEPLARRALTERLDRERLRALPHYTTYPCRDGEWIALGIVDERKFWVALCEVLGIRRFSGLSIPMRAALSPVLKPILRWLIRRHPRDYWLERMGAADLPVTPVLSPRDALQDVHIASRLVKGEDLRAPLAGSSFVEGPAPDGPNDALS